MASNIDTVDQINDYILSLILGDEREYLNFDFVDMYDAIDNTSLEAITLKFLDTLKILGLPNHRIKLKMELQ